MLRTSILLPLFRSTEMDQEEEEDAGQTGLLEREMKTVVSGEKPALPNGALINPSGGCSNNRTSSSVSRWVLFSCAMRASSRSCTVHDRFNGESVKEPGRRSHVSATTIFIPEPFNNHPHHGGLQQMGSIRGQ
jgi:hypothetical protein